MRERLAVLGGPPSFDSELHVGRPNIGNAAAMLARVGEIFQRRWFTNDGPLVREFETKVAEYVGVRHCICMCNATIALEIAIRALGLKCEVIVPSYTFVATAHALSWQGITPVFADIKTDTHVLDPENVRKLITPRTTGIIGVHLWGRPCEIDELSAIANEYRLKLIYDAAHAFGCSHQGQMIGGFGDCEVFSFHATKFLNSFEGGAIVTNDSSLAEKMRLMRNFGFAGYDRVIYEGTNGKLTEVCAAMGLTSLESIDELIEINKRNYNAYRRALGKIGGISLLAYPTQEKNNFQYIVAEIEGSFGLKRDDLIAVLHAENILARKYFWPGCHRMEPYRSQQLASPRGLPVTERVAARVVVLPTGQTLEEQMVQQICDVIHTAKAKAREIGEALAG